MGSERRIEPWPIALAALLLAMMAGSLGFLAVASAHPDPLVVDDAYAAGLRYNEELRTQQRAEARGLALDLAAERHADGVRVAVAVLDAEGTRLAVDRVVVRRERPTQGGFDADFELDTGDGTRTGLVPLPLPGRWRLVATAEVDGVTLRRSFRVWK